MEIPELEKGWLARQIEVTQKEIDSWQNWMKIEMELRGRPVSTGDKEK